MVSPTALNREEILDRLQKTPIRFGQIDVNAKCNAKCWFCPVAYEDLPHTPPEMSIQDLGQILQRLRASERLGAEFQFLYTGHYNEVLLYKHFQELISTFRQHRFKTLILSNGTPLNRRNCDLIINHGDVISGLCLNIPGFEALDWSRKTGLPASLHGELFKQLDYLHEQKYPATIQINCHLDQKGLLQNGLPETYAQAQLIVRQFKQRYPAFKIALVDNLSDRAGLLNHHQVLTKTLPLPTTRFGKKLLQDAPDWVTWVQQNKKGRMAIRDVFDILVRNEFSTASIQQELGEHYPKDREDWLRHEIKVHEGQKRQITGCHHTAQDGGRIYGALHIAPTGELFLCCEDYTMAHRFGNLLEQSFDEIWHSEAHVDAILKSQQSTCQECQHRIEIRN